MLWIDLFSPHGPWDPPQPYRDQYATAEPDEFEAGDEGDLVEDMEGPEIDLAEVPVLIDVPPAPSATCSTRPSCSGSGGPTPAPSRSSTAGSACSSTP